MQRFPPRSQPVDDLASSHGLILTVPGAGRTVPAATAEVTMIVKVLPVTGPTAKGLASGPVTVPVHDAGKTTQLNMTVLAAMGVARLEGGADEHDAPCDGLGWMVGSASTVPPCATAALLPISRAAMRAVIFIIVGFPFKRSAPPSWSGRGSKSQSKARHGPGAVGTGCETSVASAMS